MTAGADNTAGNGVVLRHSMRDVLGCGECGAEARWSEHPQYDDKWTLVCGHNGSPVPIRIAITTTLDPEPRP